MDPRPYPGGRIFLWNSSLPCGLAPSSKPGQGNPPDGSPRSRKKTRPYSFRMVLFLKIYCYGFPQRTLVRRRENMNIYTSFHRFQSGYGRWTAVDDDTFFYSDDPRGCGQTEEE